jgi:hypothetical protein
VKESFHPLYPKRLKWKGGKGERREGEENGGEERKEEEEEAHHG